MSEPQLLRLVSDRRYEQALRHLETHPDEVTARDGNNKTALRKLCQEVNPSPIAVDLAQAMCELRPELLVEDMENNQSLLHEAVAKSRSGAPRSTGLALVLISADPAIVSIRNKHCGFTPFHTACDADADIVVLRAMLEVNPDLAAAMAQNSKTPMDILLRKNGWNISGTAMDKVALILLTNFKGRVMDPLPMHQMVHAVCCYPRPLTFLTRIMKTFPEQTHQPDDEGLMPLHYAVKHVGQWDDPENPFVYSNFVFQKLMKLVRAAPEALSTLDPSDGIYPVLSSATRANDTTIHLSVTYQLLLAAPEIMLHAISNDDGRMEAQNDDNTEGRACSMS